MEFSDSITILSGKNRYPVNVRIILKKSLTKSPLEPPGITEHHYET